MTVTDSSTTAVSWQAQIYTAVQDAALVQRLYQLSYTGYDYYNLNGLGERTAGIKARSHALKKLN